MYNFTSNQLAILDSIKSLRIAITSQTPSSPTRQLLMDTYDTLMNQLAIDIGNTIIKTELLKDNK